MAFNEFTLVEILNMSSRWSANTDREKNKLALKESDWNLPGSGGLTATRTRRGGIQKKAVTAASDESSDDSSYDGDSEEDNSDDVLDEWVTKPEPTRMLFETDALKDLIERTSTCPKCGSAVLVSFKTVTIASSVEIQCSSEKCGYIDHGTTPA